MAWWQFALLGGIGGALAEFVALFMYVQEWQMSRRSSSGMLSEDLVEWRTYVDVPAHVWMLAMRILAGMASAGAFAVGGQIKGAFAAIALGYGGPAVLERFGQLHLISSRVNGAPVAFEPAVAASLKPTADAASAPHEAADQLAVGGDS